VTVALCLENPADTALRPNADGLPLRGKACISQEPSKSRNKIDGMIV
jgi:hypothetical protein